MDQHLINRAFDQFKHLKAVVIGDVMIDSYFWGKTERISPEAPVPVVSVKNKENRLGGAANVARNIKALDAEVFLCTVIGDDEGGTTFESLMKDENMPVDGLIKDEARPTTVKTRVISQSQQMLRIDEETISPINRKINKKLIERIQSIIENEDIDVVIFEDYDKGLITPNLIKQIITFCREHGVPVTVDPKKNNFKAYKHATLFKPNLKELREGLKIEMPEVKKENLDKAIALLNEKIEVDQALITLSERGVYINTAQGSKIIPAHIRNIADVSGAGDTVIAVASLCLALGMEPEFTAQLANLAGGLVCEQIGVVPINKNLLEDEALRLSK
ncbi:D-glycero-beta-D-manno-heptose-7-phosphate kinase [Salibacter sp.]|uniref:D-glycero-beta-D-manno-heptose-7-phosphate kinase n=1 Tax=Salibacter sp. TaxID=2010995 RepID=UPI00286FE401|nr:D-glycero-beta-D-manno-heptose-7-phosphate kinase [Salibacter sp.]MDR9399110.1 D-glycero-beta-D-manno-heptose-7-phosphate kinase [Salibacter sp.]MDR9488163.1 D-glycero-beta-D-manno-heptose-7-phosphate kinase [Salibacter sp.]